MGEWMLRELNKVDRPFQLLVWYEHGQDLMTIRKIKEEEMMVVNIHDELTQILKLSETQQTKKLAELPYKVEAKIKKQLGIKGSLPYEIRGWVSTVGYRQKERAGDKQVNLTLKKAFKARREPKKEKQSKLSEHT